MQLNQETATALSMIGGGIVGGIVGVLCFDTHAFVFSALVTGIALGKFLTMFIFRKRNHS